MMEQKTSLASNVQDNVSAVSHQGAAVSLNYDLPVMVLVAVLLSIVTLMTVFGNLLVWSTRASQKSSLPLVLLGLGLPMLRIGPSLHGPYSGQLQGKVRCLP